MCHLSSPFTDAPNEPSEKSSEGSRSVNEATFCGSNRMKYVHVCSVDWIKLVGNVSCQAGTNIFSYGSNDDEEDLRFSEEDSRRRGDPCFHYTVLDQAWRATNTTTKFKMCDRHVKWKGSYIFCLTASTLMMMEILILLLFCWLPKAGTASSTKVRVFRCLRGVSPWTNAAPTPRCGWRGLIRRERRASSPAGFAATGRRTAALSGPPRSRSRSVAATTTSTSSLRPHLVIWPTVQVRNEDGVIPELHFWRFLEKVFLISVFLNGGNENFAVFNLKILKLKVIFHE